LAPQKEESRADGKKRKEGSRGADKKVVQKNCSSAREGGKVAGSPEGWKPRGITDC